jgi:hypothetical protein
MEKAKARHPPKGWLILLLRKIWKIILNLLLHIQIRLLSCNQGECSYLMSNVPKDCLQT